MTFPQQKKKKSVSNISGQKKIYLQRKKKREIIFLKLDSFETFQYICKALKLEKKKLNAEKKLILMDMRTLNISCIFFIIHYYYRNQNAYMVKILMPAMTIL